MAKVIKKTDKKKVLVSGLTRAVTVQTKYKGETYENTRCSFDMPDGSVIIINISETSDDRNQYQTKSGVLLPAPYWVKMVQIK